jgi:hypothetical protein
MSDQRTEGGWRALTEAPSGIPPICAACGCVDDAGVVYDDGPEAWQRNSQACVADVVRVAGAEQEGGR